MLVPAVVLRVADDGIGIRPDQLDKRAEGHLGLRLLIDRIADQGGSLTIEARPEGGTVALASLPVEGPVDPTPPPASPARADEAREPAMHGTAEAAVPPNSGAIPPPRAAAPSSPAHTD